LSFGTPLAVPQTIWVARSLLGLMRYLHNGFQSLHLVPMLALQLCQLSDDPQATLLLRAKPVMYRI
jgi:hypothetical protein